MEEEVVNTLIGPNDLLLKWMVIFLIVGIGVTLEKRTKWGEKLSSVIIVIFLGMLVANLRIMPFASPVFGATSSTVLPLAIPLLLFKSDLVKIIKFSGNTFIVFVWTAIIAFIATLVIPLIMPGVDSIAEFSAMLSGAVIGGTVNAIAISNIWAVPPELVSGLAIVGNFFVAMMVVIAGLMYKMKWFQNNFKHGGYEADDNTDEKDPLSAQISMLTIAQSLAVTFAITGVAWIIARFVNSFSPPFAIAQSFGSMWINMTIITVVLATLFPKFFESMKGSTELGQLIMLLWFTTIGMTADIGLIISNGLVVLAGYTIVFIFVNVFVLGLGKILGWKMENMFVCMQAAIGGPSTAAALAISMKWSKLIVPGILVALLGVIIGNFAGLAVGMIWNAVPFAG